MAGRFVNDWIWRDHALISSVAMTFQLAGSAMLLSAVLGGAMGLVIAGALPNPGERKFWRAALAWPFVLPGSVAALRLLPWLDRVEWSYSALAVVVVMTWMNAPYVALRVAQARVQLDVRLLEQAKVLGAGFWARFRAVLWPALGPAWGIALSEVYLACLGALSIVLLVGGGPPVETVEVTLFHRLQGAGLDWFGSLTAGFVTVVLASPAAVVLFLSARSSGQGLFLPEPPGAGSRPAFGFKGLAWLCLLLCLAPWVLPEGRMSLSGEGLGEFARSGLVSACYAGGVALMVTLAAVAIVARVGNVPALQMWAGFSALASSFPPMLIALGLIFLHIAVGQDPFAHSRVLLVIGLFAAFLPFALRSLLWLQASRPVALLEAAAVCGARPAQAWRWVEWPRWKPIVLSVFGLLFVWALGESSLTWLFAADGGTPWVTALLARWAGQYRMEEVRAGTTLMLIVSAMGFFWLGGRRS